VDGGGEVPAADRAEVARITSEYDLVAVPVVDAFDRIIGVITVDDVIDAIVEEQTEDVQKLGAVQPLEEPYFTAGFWSVARKRVGWLVVLFIGEMFTGTVMRSYEETLAEALALTLFIPLIISSGGNSGAQSSALITRALAVGDVSIRDAMRVLLRELGQGVVLGTCLGVIGLLRALMWGTHRRCRSWSGSRWLPSCSWDRWPVPCFRSFSSASASTRPSRRRRS
jgi:magnesium transporter